MGTTALSDRKLDERKEWAGEIAALEAAHLKAIPGLDAAEAAAAARVAEATEALKEAVAAHRATLSPRSDAALRFTRQRDLLEGRLRDTAPPEIDEFIDETKVESDRLMLVGHPGSVASRQARIAGLRDARLQAEAFNLLPLTRSELNERLHEIRDCAVEEVAT